jgi:hypothetical protein
MNNKLEKSILSTLIYFDLFDYPLTLKEIWRCLYRPIDNNRELKVSIFNIQEALETSRNLSKTISFKNGFYFLKGRESLIEKREKYYKIAQPKWKIAQRAAKYLELIPFIRMVAVCNTLAYNNAKEKSDIDFFIVVKSDKIWTARFLATILMQFLGLRRYSQKIKDRICLSFYVTEDNLDLSKIAIENDIYLKYWITQVIPLSVKNSMDNKFTEANKWVKKYLPNFIPYQVGKRREVLKNKFFAIKRVFGEWLLRNKFGDFIENWLRKIQKNKMDRNNQSLAKKSGTEVIISDKMLKFHEIDIRKRVKEEFLQKMKVYGEK